MYRYLYYDIYGVQGKIVFVAPTKPLLTQQVEACYWKMGVSRV